MTTEATAEADPPVALREILKKQPYVVVERDSTKTDREVRSVFHLTNSMRSHRSRTLCGVRFTRATHVPLESWGALDSEWCRSCMFLAKNSVKNQLKEQMQKHRRAAAEADQP